MSHDENHSDLVIAKIVRMANQIGTFFLSKPHEEGVVGTAEHINKFWEPRMRRHFFEVLDAGGEGLLPIVKEAAASVRRPAVSDTAANSVSPDGQGGMAGSADANIASQG